MKIYLILSIFVLIAIVQAADPVDSTIQSQRVDQLCTEGYFWTGQLCAQCDTPTLANAYCTCDASNYCLDQKCKTGYQNMGDEKQMICVQIPQGCTQLQLNEIETSYICKQCQEGYVLIQGICVLQGNCSQFDLNTGICTQCQDGTYFNWETKYEFCAGIESYYTNFKSQCSQCNSSYNCQTCAGDFDCLTCQAGYDWSFGSGCVRDTSCSIVDCYACSDAQTCVSCGNTTSKQLFNNQCIQCSDNCLECTSTTECKTCESGYFAHAGKCYQEITGCAQNIWKSNGTVTCDACQDTYYRKVDANDATKYGCDQCSNIKSSAVRCYGPNDNVAGYSGSDVVITQCTSSYYAYNGDCVSIQSSSCWTYSDGSNNCATCRPTDNILLLSGKCQGCSIDCPYCKAVANAQVCTGCSPKYYLNVSENECSSCPSRCLQCFNGNICEQCESGNYLNLSDYSCEYCTLANCDKCDSKYCYSCKDGYSLNYQNNQQYCLECIDYCQQCSQVGICDQCKSNYLNNNGSCISLADANCMNNNQDGCVACNYGFQLVNGLCYQCVNPFGNGICNINLEVEGEDEAAQVIQETNISMTKDFIAPYQTNHQIQGSRVTEACNKGYYFTGQSCQPCQQIQNGYCECSSYGGCDQIKCDSNALTIGNTKNCDGQCSEGCNDCQLNADQSNTIICVACKSGYTLVGGVCLLNNNCNTFDQTTGICKQCSDGYYFNYRLQLNQATLTNFNFCAQCGVQNCSKCNSYRTCSQCQPGYTWKLLDGEGTCTQLSCVANCLTCQDSTNCQVCEQGYYIDSVTTPGTKICSKCIDNCIECQDQNTCKLCLSNFFLTDANTCTACPNGCQKCTNLTTCTECLDGQFPDGANCYEKIVGCAVNAVTSGKVTCTACQDTYTRTANGSEFTCTLCAQQNIQWLRCAGPNDDPKKDTLVPTQCNDYFYLFNNQCFEFQQDDECVEYATNDNDDCSSCKPAFQYYANNNCGSCDSDCSVCKGNDSNDLDCTVCLVGNYLYSNGNCYSCMTGCAKCTGSSDCSECLDKYYQDEADSCASCSTDNCRTCTNNVCSICMPYYYLQTSGENNDVKECVGCPKNCMQCNGSTCQQCDSSSQLLKGVCVDPSETNCAVFDENRVCQICMHGYYMNSNTECFQCVNPYSGYVCRINQVEATETQGQ